jgi:hypothetical protein
MGFQARNEKKQQAACFSFAWFLTGQQARLVQASGQSAAGRGRAAAPEGF